MGLRVEILQATFNVNPIAISRFAIILFHIGNIIFHSLTHRPLPMVSTRFLRGDNLGKRPGGRASGNKMTFLLIISWTRKRTIVCTEIWRSVVLRHYFILYFVQRFGRAPYPDPILPHSLYRDLPKYRIQTLFYLIVCTEIWRNTVLRHHSVL